MVEKTFVYPSNSNDNWVVCQKEKIKKIFIQGLPGAKFYLYTMNSVYSTIILGPQGKCEIDLTNISSCITKITSDIKNFTKIPNEIFCYIKILSEEE